MVSFKFISEHIANNGNILRVYEYTKGLEQKNPLFCVHFRRGFNWFVLKDGLTRKPNKRQIENYLNQI